MDQVGFVNGGCAGGWRVGKWTSGKKIGFARGSRLKGKTVSKFDDEIGDEDLGLLHHCGVIGVCGEGDRGGWRSAA